MIYDFKIIKKKKIHENLDHVYYQFKLNEKGPYLFSMFHHSLLSKTIDCDYWYGKAFDDLMNNNSKYIGNFSLDQIQAIASCILKQNEYRLRHLLSSYTVV